MSGIPYAELQQRTRVLPGQAELPWVVGPPLPVAPPSVITPVAGRKLFPFQEEGVRWLADKEKALLADDMGLGKTVQAIVWAASRKPVLVVVPSALLYNWRSEITEKWRPGDQVTLLTGDVPLPKPLTDWTVITYETLPRYLDRLKTAGFRTIMLDEAHYIKNPAAKRTRNVLDLALNATPPIPSRLAVTGTPITNRPPELFALLVFLGLEERGAANAERFADRYTVRKKGRGGVVVITGYRHLDELHERIKTFTLRRLKKDVLTQLPPKVYRPVFTALSNADEYREAEQNFLRWVAEHISTEKAQELSFTERGQLLSRLNHLRHLAAIGKTEPVRDFLKPCADTGHKVVTFSGFKEPLQTLHAAKPDSLLYLGETSKEDREAMVKQFQSDPSLCFFFGSIGAAGVGITLTAADRVVFVDLPWTPAAKTQAEDRTHRIGQLKPVEIVTFLARGTIDERILTLLTEKEQVIAQAVDGFTADRALQESVTNQLMQSYITQAVHHQDPPLLPRYISDEDAETLQGYRQMSKAKYSITIGEVGRAKPEYWPGCNYSVSFRKHYGNSSGHSTCVVAKADILVLWEKMRKDWEGFDGILDRIGDKVTLRNLELRDSMRTGLTKEELLGPAGMGGGAKATKRVTDGEGQAIPRPKYIWHHGDIGKVLSWDGDTPVVIYADDVTQYSPKGLWRPAEEQDFVGLLSKRMSEKRRHDLEYWQEDHRYITGRPSAPSTPESKSNGAQARLFQGQQPTPVRISGVCKGSEPSCRITAKATKEVSAVATSPSELAQAIAEARRLFAERIGRPEPVEGDRTKTFALGPTGRRYEFEYQIRDAPGLITSHDPYTFELDPRFTKALQPRVRERAAAQAQVLRIAANLDPDQLLIETHTLDRGAPIVGPDMLVESGNGRVMGVKRSARESKPVYEKYLAALRDRASLFGLRVEDVDNVNFPILVRVRLTPLADKDRQTFVQEANEPSGIEMSPVEKARSDAQRLTPAMLGSLEVAEGEDISDALRAQKNRVFVQAFLSKLPPNEQARLVDAQGAISQEGVRRMVLAIFMAAFPGGPGQQLAEMAFESADMEVRTLFNGVARALGFLAQAEALTRTGNRRPALTIGEDLAKAISVYASIRRQDLTVKKYMAQSQMFTRELSPFQETILQTIVETYWRIKRQEGKEVSREEAERAVGAKRVASILAGYAQMVIADTPPGQGEMIEGTKLSKEEMWATAVRVAAEPELVPQPAMFAQAAFPQFMHNWLLVGKTTLGLPVGVRFLRAALFTAERIARTWGEKLGAERVDLYEWDGKRKQPKSPTPEKVLQLARGLGVSPAFVRSLPKDREVAFALCNHDPRQGLAGARLGSSAQGDYNNVNLSATCPVGTRLVGTLHTHPGGEPIPSQQDRETAAREGLKHLCVGVPETGALRCESH